MNKAQKTKLHTNHLSLMFKRISRLRPMVSNGRQTEKLIFLLMLSSILSARALFECKVHTEVLFQGI